MILVDTSVWVDHLRTGSQPLAELLSDFLVLTHPFVIGELACGSIRNRGEVLRLLTDLPRVEPATDAEVLFFIDQHRLMGRGIGYVDAHLLAAVSLLGRASLWTRDLRLDAAARKLGLAHRV